MRPNDVVGFRERLQIAENKGLAPATAKVRVTKTQSHPAPNNYDKEIPIKVDWRVPPEASQRVSALLRSATRQSDLNWNTHQIVIKNQGTETIRTLQLELSYFDGDNIRIGTETEYAVFVSGAALPPGQSRLVNFNSNGTEAPKGIRLKVIDLN